MNCGQLALQDPAPAPGGGSAPRNPVRSRATGSGHSGLVVPAVRSPQAAARLVAGSTTTQRHRFFFGRAVRRDRATTLAVRLEGLAGRPPVPRPRRFSLWNIHFGQPRSEAEGARRRGSRTQSGASRPQGRADRASGRAAVPTVDLGCRCGGVLEAGAGESGAESRGESGRGAEGMATRGA